MDYIPVQLMVGLPHKLKQFATARVKGSAARYAAV
jgi:hypothetical protein